jgi:DNA-binding NarL/FixJ family response regulator
MVGGLRQAVLAAAPDAEIAVPHDFDSMVAALDASPDTDLVLLDLAMPGIRRFSGLLFLRSQRPSTPVIIVSGNEERAVIRHCMEFGAAGFIAKTSSLDTMPGANRRGFGRRPIDAFRLRPKLGSQWPIERDGAAACVADPATDSGLDDAFARPAQQTDRLRAWRLRSDRQGACLSDLPKAWRREPNAGGHSRNQNETAQGLLIAS